MSDEWIINLKVLNDFYRSQLELAVVLERTPTYISLLLTRKATPSRKLEATIKEQTIKIVRINKFKDKILGVSDA